MRKIVSFAALALIVACSEAPENIAAADIGQGAYRGQNCDALAAARFTRVQTLEDLSRSQRRARGGDTVGVILLGLPLSRMAGNDRETEIAIQRGHIREIEREMQARGCPMPPALVVSGPAPPPQPSVF
jgi:hypothetical protein